MRGESYPASYYRSSADAFESSEDKKVAVNIVDCLAFAYHSLSVEDSNNRLLNAVIFLFIGL